MALDERIERELDRMARPADPSGVYEGLIRRRERLRLRRRVSAAAIAFMVFIGGAVGVYALSRTIGSEPRLAAVPTTDVPTEAPTAETSSRRSPTQVGPIALCETTSVGGTFGSSASATAAVVGMLPRPDGTCRRPTGDAAVEGVAVIDVTGDGSLMVASEPFPCDESCNAYAAPDVDGDGTDELLVQDVQFSVAGLLLLDVVGGDAEPVLRAATVASPGDEAMSQQGFDGSTLPRFWIGGDGFGSDGLRCEPSPDGRLLVSSSAQMDPPDSSDAVWKVHETTFRLESGVLTVVNIRDYREPTGIDAPASFRDTGGCGADLEPSS